MSKKTFILTSAFLGFLNLNGANLIKNADFENPVTNIVTEANGNAFYRLSAYFSETIEAANPNTGGSGLFEYGNWHVKTENSGYFRLFLRDDDGFNSTNCAELRLGNGSAATGYDSDHTKLAITQRIKAERKRYKLKFDAKRVSHSQTNYCNTVYPFMIASNSQANYITSPVDLIQDNEWHNYEVIIDLSTASNTTDWSLGIGIMTEYPGTNTAGKPITAFSAVKLDNISLEEDIQENDVVENLFSFDFNDGINDQWSAEEGKIEITEEHYYEGTKALNWIPGKENASLSVSFIEAFNLTNNAFFFNIYNKYPAKDGKLQIEFLNSSNETIRIINIDMDFMGWREYKRIYDKDFDLKTAGSISKVNFNYSGDADAYICLDNVNFLASGSSSGTLNDLAKADISQITSATNRMALCYSLIPDFSGYTATAEEIADLETIRKVYEITTPSYNSLRQTSARQYVTAFGIQRNDDGTIKGSAIPTGTIDNTFWTDLTRNLEILAYGTQVGTNAANATAFNDLLDQVIEQGLFYMFGGFTYSDYTSLRTIPLQLINILPACNDIQREEVLKAAKWFVEYGTLYNPDYNLKMSSDYIYNILQYPFIIAANITDNNEAVQEIKGLSEYLSKATEYTPGNIGFLKPDGCGFHHNSHYINYMYSYRSFNTLMGSLKGTSFRISQDGYERFRKAVLSQFLMASRNAGSLFTANSLSGRHPIVGGNVIQFTKADLDELILTGGDIYGTGIDETMAAAYNYFFNDTKYNVAAVDYEGFYQFNYSPIGVYRHNDWVATMRTPTTKFWGAEIYNATNRFGRYQSHGTLEIVYNNYSLVNSGLPAFEQGWDWNVVPGTTTVHYTDWKEMLPNKNITDRFDQYAKTTNFAGALAWGDCGMFGSEFDQIDTWGSQRFTPTNLTFKKSVYAFDGILISLGSDISTSGTYSDDMITATNLFQSVSPSRALYVNGTEMKSGDSDLILSGSDISILTPEGTGYFIPSGNDNLTVKFGLQYGPHENGSDYTNPASAIAAKAYINHGVKQSNGKYSFVAIPGIDKDKLASYAEKMSNNGGEIFSVENQDENYHAIYYKPRNILAASLFKAQELKLGDVCAVGSEMLIMQQKKNDSRVMFAVTNPNLKPENVTENGVTYWKSTPTETSVTLNGTWFIVAGSDETVTISHSNGKTTVEMIITDGEPVYFSLDKSEEDANIPNGITSSKNNDSVNAYVSKASQSVVLNWGDETVSRIDIMNLYGQIVKSEPVKAGVKNANIFLGTNSGTCLIAVIYTESGRKVIKMNY